MKRHIAVLASLSVCSFARAQVIPVTVEKTPTGAFRLLRGGKPFFVKGAGGSGSLERLKATGANAIRTWGVDENTGKLLDDAHKLGIGVVVGVWLGHERHGFNYNKADQVADQVGKVRDAIQKYKNHPAVLAWGLGNEMEGYDKADNAAIWSHLEALASMAHRLDPSHPTMTVVAELGGEKVKWLERLCPSIDILGINSYAGGPSIPVRYKDLGGTKPYLLTEFGPAGTWETSKTDWGAPIEPTSTEKAGSYKKTWTDAIANQPMSLGGFAFTWGNKQESTATWFGMLLPDGSKTPAVDAMTELWTGKAPADRCPTVSPLQLSGSAAVEPGATLSATLTASDPEGKPVSVKWVLTGDSASVNLGGDAEAAPPTFPDALSKTSGTGATVTLPKAPGPYRLFAYVTDPAGNSSIANVPLLVKGAVSGPKGTGAKLPFTVYAEKGEKPTYVPTGWMGNTGAIQLDEGWTKNPHSGATCIKVTFGPATDWGGVVWQWPPGDWGDAPGGFDLTGATKLTFWAKGDFGGETVGFKFGLLGKDKKYADSASGESGDLALTSVWKKYEISLAGKDLTRIKTGFCWVTANAKKPINFYLDDIRYE